MKFSVELNCAPNQNTRFSSSLQDGFMSFLKVFAGSEMQIDNKIKCDFEREEFARVAYANFSE